MLPLLLVRRSQLFLLLVWDSSEILMSWGPLFQQDLHSCYYVVFISAVYCLLRKMVALVNLFSMRVPCRNQICVSCTSWPILRSRLLFIIQTRESPWNEGVSISLVGDHPCFEAFAAKPTSRVRITRCWAKPVENLWFEEKISITWLPSSNYYKRNLWAIKLLSQTLLEVRDSAVAE